MAKIEYEGIRFDSELEIEYYKKLLLDKEVLDFFYNDRLKPMDLGLKRKYTPDFLVKYKDHWELIETKGYNQFSFRIDAEIDMLMKKLDQDELRTYCESCLLINIDLPIVYKKIKFLKKYGWVDFSFKPKTLSSQRKEKIVLLENSLKETKRLVKDAKRYMSYLDKQRENKKLNEKQLDFMKKFEVEIREWKNTDI